ncbi:DNA photolyase family protein [Pseudooceanicola sp. CBS1P-1]|uniref:Deoxyribodipyrimidine photo-lyase n=1 Tax=Pseudooceanicola albus TaxID=2692189 RepID=A0A6L7FZI1_9RHOB|nr:MULTISPECIES: deoxyribodipyrimidine photo-lyase [Pseudooceanicola]MBT9383660.1 DNA photolyase family protein [Pseudooceanicola endophyticus]MXN17514.1 deoxyribodipyrimidine photo-lyase [Pseudooceanicola albus]
MTTPTLLWLRRDLRLSDHAALEAAVARGGPVIPVYIRDHLTDALGAAPKQRLDMALEVFAETLEAKGSRLILRAGPAREVLEDLVRETGAGAVYWQRLHDPQAVERDTRVKSALKDAGLEVRSFPGQLLFEPWGVATGQGGYYRVFTPYWRAVKDRAVPEPLAAPADLPAPARWPGSDRRADWALSAPMRRGAAVLRAHVAAGEAAALTRLATFARDRIARYAEDRDLPAEDATSDMSQYLTTGEISPRRCWHAGLRARAAGKPGAETFLKELAWREFAAHLAWHSPELLSDNWRPEWRDFPWDANPERPEVLAWKQGRTGIPFVDAAMRELYVTGRMHNRARMIVASYLTKNLLAHWKIGCDWFADTLVDWDPASNAMGWQWVAGSGPDAAPYFRVFNPETQAEKFDPDRIYRRRWLAEGQAQPPDTALAFYQAIPRSWQLAPSDPPPTPREDPKRGRQRALDAYQTFRAAREEAAD